MDIPKKAKKVFNGIIFDVYQWQEKMPDGSHQTFEMLKRPHTIEVIATCEKGVYIAKQEQPDKPFTQTLFGGRLEENEKPLDAAKRELLEEAGLSSRDWELFKIYDPHHKIDWKVYVFIAKNCKIAAKQKLDPGENIEVKLFTFNEFMKIASSGEFWWEKFSDDMFRIKSDKKKLKSFRRKLFSK